MFKKKFISKKYYQVLFTVTFSILILLSCLLSYLAVSFYVSESNKKTLQIANDYLEDAASNYRELTREIDVLYGFLSGNTPAVTEYLTKKQDNAGAALEVLNAIKNIELLNPYISSIILYNHVNENYLCSDPDFDMKLFLKVFLTNSIENLPAQAKNKAVFVYRDRQQAEADSSSPYLCMVYYILNKYTQNYYSVVFNLDAVKIGKDIIGGPAREIPSGNVFLVNYSSHYFFQLHWIKVVKNPLNAKALLNVHPSSGIM